MHYRGVNSVLASFFFLSLKIVGGYILLLLLLAILIEHFDESSMLSQEPEEKKNKDSYIDKFFRKFRCLSKKVSPEDEEKVNQ